VGIISGEEESPEPLLIEGSVEGSITLPGNRVTVGHEAQVTADIIARDIVVMGRIDGNLTASVSLEIYANGAVTGDVSAARIRVEDGAFMKGNVNVRRAVTEPAADTPETREISSARPHVRPQHVHHTLQPA
jgi:cytoskeletal protein CcmA (bactofilin family)